MALGTLMTMTRLKKYRCIAITGSLVVAVRVGLRIMSLPRLLTWLDAGLRRRTPDLAFMERCADVPITPTAG